VRLVTTYLNRWIELLDGEYDEDVAAELGAVVRLYNRSIGPVTSVNLVRPDLFDASLYSAYCHHSPLPSLIPDLTVKAAPHAGLVPGGGKGARPLGALLGALGEITERLMAILHVTTLLDRIVYATYEQLHADGHSALSPDEVPLFALEQYARPGFEYQPFRTDSLIGWIAGHDLVNDEPVFVPAQLVLMYQKRDPRETPIGYATTAGLACHTSREQAILHGLYEVIERDTLNVSWYSRLAPPRIDVDLPTVLADFFDAWPTRIATPPVSEVELYLMTLDAPIPVLAAVAYDRSRGERAFLGGTGAAGRREGALGQALFELGQCQTGFRFEDPFGRNPIYEDSPRENVVEFFDAPLYYGYARNLPRTYWFTSNHETIPWADVPSLSVPSSAEFAFITGWLMAAGIRVVVMDFDDACPADIHVTKVFVPQLTHACPPANPMLGHPRFAHLAAQLDSADRALSFADLNPDPIPFA
jgi:ribosomal protein S12 methylthiotransferase accessory factor